jgi:hypothetical protein
MVSPDAPAWQPIVRGLAVEPNGTLPHIPGQIVGHMLRNTTLTTGRARSGTQQAPQWLAGLVHFRLLPGGFPDGMRYHFDGLAMPLRFAFESSNSTEAPLLSWIARPYESNAYKEYKRCLFFGTGTGPTLGTHLCFTNPGVNLLPLEGPPPARQQQLWLTIDTSSWGQVDIHQ